MGKINRVCSLFAGMGGIDLGFQQAGFDIVWANEYDQEAAITYRINFVDEHLVEKDIRLVNPHDIPDFDVLVAGFPCQPFSTAGLQRGFADPRGNLFFEISKVLDVKRPRIVFLENVENLIAHDNGKTFLVIYNTLAQFGYAVKYKVMDSQEYYFAPNGELVCFDAYSVNKDKGLIMRKDYLDKFLLEKGYALIWSCIGEKQFFKGGQAWGIWSGLFYYQDEKIVGEFKNNRQD